MSEPDADTGMVAPLRTPKTESSVRDFSILPAVSGALRDHRRAALSRGLWGFPTAGGLPIERNNFVREVFEPLLRSAGVSILTFHSFRELAATLLAESGLPMPALKAIYGSCR